MTDWQPNKQATFEKNEDYWNADAVKIQNLVMNLVKDPQNAATSFGSGEKMCIRDRHQIVVQ